ncbi:NAD dependent epimerase/dehydratase family protein [Aureobasidium pullulans]|uniref:NAD dependent epimerase/dehydratase family protein n=1 Tax=Aureobasidium pullulans TaxID=5580 RepID=A0A4S9A2A5_AURPU|nr:NAD dependent epimerase/dehydratase family protein [Aureobasidium pullulans]
MPKILILGGTGLLGTALAQSLLRAGNNTVFVQTRAASKRGAIVAAEMTPLVFPLEDKAALRSALDTYNIDTVVDVSQGYQQATSILETVVSVAKDRKAALAREGAIGPKLGFVYTSGIMVHGSPAERVSDLSPVGNKLASDKPATMVSWRPSHEQAVLACRDFLNTVILRPGMLYGRNAWNFGVWWGPVSALKAKGGEKLSISADKSTRVCLVHVDDVASAFRAAIDRLDGRLGDWPVFDVVAETISLESIIEGTTEAVGLKTSVDFIGTGGDVFLEAMGLRANVDSSRARTVLGWEPRRRDFLLNVGTYYAAWEVAQ